MSLTRHISSNIDALIAEMEAQRPPNPDWALEVVNDTFYARYLHDRLGYWVMNDSAAQAMLYEQLAAAVDESAARGVLLAHERVEAAFAAAADGIVEYYQSIIGQKHTRGRYMPPPRPKHPGEWASDSTTLVSAYVTYVRSSGMVLRFQSYQDWVSDLGPRRGTA